MKATPRTLTALVVLVHQHRHVGGEAAERHHVFVRVERDVAHGVRESELVVNRHLVACNVGEDRDRQAVC